MARNYTDHGLLTDAVQCLETTLPTAKIVLGTEHPITLDVMNSLGRMYGDQGRLDDAIELLQETLGRRHVLLGWENAKTLETASHLAWTHGEKGLAAKRDIFPLHQQGLFLESRVIEERFHLSLRHAESLRKTIYDVRLRILGNDHYDTMQSAIDLAWVYGKQDRTIEAIALFIAMYPKMEKYLGERHSNTLWILKSLAKLYQKNGQFMEAEACYKKLLGLIKSFGESDVRIIIIQGYIALIYKLQGRIDDAIEIFEKLMDGVRLDILEEYPQIWGSINNLADLYLYKGDIMKALSLHENLYITRAKVLGADHTDTIRSRLWVHHIQQRLGMK